jgi:hypothetical protein
LHFGERAPSRIEKFAVIPGALPGGSLGDVKGNAIRRPPKLIGESFLLKIREALSGARALNSESLGMLPRFQCVMVRHFGRISRTCRIIASFHLIPYPVYSKPRCVCNLVFACPRLVVRQF